MHGWMLVACLFMVVLAVVFAKYDERHGKQARGYYWAAVAYAIVATYHLIQFIR